MNNKKAIVFMIMPFGEDFIALYDELRQRFSEEFLFTNGGDLDNQQNILEDIVQGISKADVIIADLTTLNPNVFYELGLAHAMNKKVIIITQDLGDLPFDIKSYRANEYSLNFNKITKLINELDKLLHGAIDGSVKYGNPVFDYLPDYNPISLDEKTNQIDLNKDDSNSEQHDYEDDKGFLDFIADIQENADIMTDEINDLHNNMDAMSNEITNAASEINRVKNQSGSVNPNFARKICKKLAAPIEEFSNKLKLNVEKISDGWSIVENSYLSLLESKFLNETTNKDSLIESVNSLEEMHKSIDESNSQIESFIIVVKDTIGIERKLNKALNELIIQLESYLSMTDMMKSSIDRIIKKSKLL